MNKRLLVGLFSAFMAMAPWCGNAAMQSTDSPHARLTDGCENCHFAGLSPGGCTVNCHKSDVPPYADTVSPVAVTHKDLKCEACHNPHVSLQDQSAVPPVVTGAYTGVQPYTGGLVGDLNYNPNTGTTTLTGVTPPPAIRWAMKYGLITTDVNGVSTGIGKDRGMILWVNNGIEVVNGQNVQQRASFEIKAVDVTNNTVTVQGDATAITPGGFELRWGQLIAQKVTRDTTKSYIDGDRPVSFPPLGSVSRYVDSNATPGSTPQGVCQVCHVGLKSNGRAFTHWNGNGENTGHNVGTDCEECHPHSSGFMVTECRKCHNGIGTGGAPTQQNELASPATGSTVAGAHELHAGGRDGGPIVFPCSYCHVGSGMDLSTPDDIKHSDGLQIGFNIPGQTMGYLTQYKGQAGVTYQGTNHTKVTNDGTAGNYTCSNVYCHSDGKATRVAGGCKTSMPSTSPSWDKDLTIPDADGTKCNNCHGYVRNLPHVVHPNTNVTGVMVSNGHYNHVTQKNGIACGFCHAGTVNTDYLAPALLAGTTQHVNGTIDISGGGGYTLSYDRTTDTCTTSCHTGTSKKWKVTTYTAYIDSSLTCPDACQDLDGAAITNTDPVILPVTTPVSPADSFIYANDPNTLHYVIRAYDTDAIDPVVAQCRGGGHANQNAFIRTVIGGGQCNTFVTTLKLKNSIASALELTCRFTDAKLATSKNMCVNYAMSDNDPPAYNLLAGGNWVVPAGNNTDGLVKPASIYCMDPTVTPANVINDSNNNVKTEIVSANPSITNRPAISVSGKTVSLTFTAKDADQVDTTKSAYWKGIYPTKTGGHLDTANHYVQINWSNEGLTSEAASPTNPTALQLIATGGSKTYYFNYNNVAGETPIQIGTNDGVATTVRSGVNAPGTGKVQPGVWIQAYICDNHVLGAENNMLKHCADTSWFYVTF